VLAATQVLAEEGNATMTGTGLLVIPLWLLLLAGVVLGFRAYRKRRRQ
jgi:hypothetical protein